MVHCCAVQHLAREGSEVQRRAMKCIVQCSDVNCSVVQFNVMYFSSAQNCTVQCNVVKCSEVQCSAPQCAESWAWLRGSQTTTAHPTVLWRGKWGDGENMSPQYIKRCKNTKFLSYVFPFIFFLYHLKSWFLDFWKYNGYNGVPLYFHKSEISIFVLKKLKI